jgi:hypothetical protein
MSEKHVVLHVVEDDEGNVSVNHVATCLDPEDAAHLAGLIERAGVIVVGDEEWVSPQYAEIAEAEPRTGS